MSIPTTSQHSATGLPSPLEDAIDKFIELHGDRVGTDAADIRGGLAWIASHRCVLISFLTDTEDPSLSPAACRKTSRLLHLAIRLQRPLLLWNMEKCLRQPGDSLLHAMAHQALMETLIQSPIPIVAFGHQENLEITDRQLRAEDQKSPESLCNSLDTTLRTLSAIPSDELIQRRMQQLQNALDNPTDR